MVQTSNTLIVTGSGATYPEALAQAQGKLAGYQVRQLTTAGRDFDAGASRWDVWLLAVLGDEPLGVLTVAASAAPDDGRLTLGQKVWRWLHAEPQ